jgi:hypothetical protein
MAESTLSVRYEVFTAMPERLVLWDMMPCGLVYVRWFGGTFCFHLQGIYMVLLSQKTGNFKFPLTFNLGTGLR